MYGDLGTSPLYVYHSIFPDGFTKGSEQDELMGALSLIIYTLFLIPLIKYAFIVMRANDNGEGKIRPLSHGVSLQIRNKFSCDLCFVSGTNFCSLASKL